MKRKVKVNNNFFIILIILLQFAGCSSLSEKSIDLLSDLMEKLKPVYIKAKKKIDAGTFNREDKARYIKEFNKRFKKHLNDRLEDYIRLIRLFRSKNDAEKLNASVEFNNYYYDASEDYVEEDEESNIAAQISFYELLTEHRTIISVNSEKYEKLSRTITLKRFEAIVLREINKSYFGGNFNRYLTGIIENILHRMLIKNIAKYRKEEEKRLASLRNVFPANKFKAMVNKRAMQRIEKSKGIMSVFVKRYIKKDLIKKLGENYFRLSPAVIKNTSLKIINECDKIVKKLTPEYKEEKKAVEKYKKVYIKEYPMLETLIKQWKKLNPIFSFANRRRTIQQ